MLTRTPAVILCLFATASLASGQDIADRFVDATITGPQDGLSWATAYDTIQEAIDSIGSFGGAKHVAVAEGTYTNLGAGGPVADLKHEGMSIHGGFIGWNGGVPNIGDDRWDFPDGSFEKTILDGMDDAIHVVKADGFFASFLSIVDGFRIENGMANGAPGDDSRGGGVFANGIDTFIKVENCHILNNQADESGGGIYHHGREFSCEKTLIEKNYAPLGAGLITQFSHFNPDFPPTFGTLLANVTFRYNGGIVPPVGRPMTLEGGAMWCYFANIVAMNCLIHDNEAYFRGGAVYFDPSTSLVDQESTWSNCTFAFNKTSSAASTDVGSGVHILSGAGNGNNKMRFNNCILWGDGPGFDIWWGNLLSPRINVILKYSDISKSIDKATGTVIPGTMLLNQNPLFMGAPSGNFTLQSSSPCIDSALDSLLPADLLDINENGNIADVLPLDLLLKKRRVNVRVDMGAYEDQDS